MEEWPVPPDWLRLLVARGGVSPVLLLRPRDDASGCLRSILTALQPDWVLWHFLWLKNLWQYSFSMTIIPVTATETVTTIIIAEMSAVTLSLTTSSHAHPSLKRLRSSAALKGVDCYYKSALRLMPAPIFRIIHIYLSVESTAAVITRKVSRDRMETAWGFLLTL